MTRGRKGDERVIYLDHAATSWPKPPEVIEAMVDAMQMSAANAGRGNHAMAVQAGRVLVRARMALAELFGIANGQDIAFAPNATFALNLAIKGALREGDHVIATMTEHNSVRRPLEYLRKTKAVEVDYLKVDTRGRVDLHELTRLFRPETKMVVCCHSSNVLGSILPIGEIGSIAKDHGALFLVDAAQSAGVVGINAAAMQIDLLAFPGHKGLLGPQGTGGLYIHPSVDLEPLLHGGTGSQSENADQPDVRPDRYEAGTQNTAAVAGLLAGVNRVKRIGVEAIYQKEWRLAQLLMEGLARIPGLTLLGPPMGVERTGVVSFVIKGVDSAEIAFRLDREFGIAVRPGMHCSPLAHEAAGTMGSGAVRASVGVDTSEAEVEEMLDAMYTLYGENK